MNNSDESAVDGYIDSHCHLQDEKMFKILADIVQDAQRAGVVHLHCCATSCDDWHKVIQIESDYPSVSASIGVHPWFLGPPPMRWLDELKQELLQHPDFGVGEIGLDASRSAVFSIEEQTHVFLHQLRLAAELNRFVSIHCVRAWNEMITLLKQEPILPPALIFHAFSGPADILQLLLDIPAYFSFGGALIGQKNKKCREAAAVCPDDRLLIETDAPDMLPRYAQPPLEPPNRPAYLPRTAAALADVRSCSVGKIANITTSNFCKILRQDHL